jgi:ferrochelatase
MRHNYTLIGGKSPLLPITRQQAEALQMQLGEAYKVFIGMRHWSPWIEDTVRDMLNEGIKEAVAIVLAPHYSQMSVARYHQKIQDGLALYEGVINFRYVDSYHTAPGYIEALANRVKEGLSHYPAGSETHVIFSAHSLPVRILKMGDPYQDQLFETARLVAKQAGLVDNQWSWSYQSAGRTPEPWLGPQIEEHIRKLAQEGKKNLVSVPVGFVSEHVEILFDIDIKAKKLAEELEIKLERPPALNTDPLYIKALAELVRGN